MAHPNLEVILVVTKEELLIATYKHIDLNVVSKHMKEELEIKGVAMAGDTLVFI